MKRTTQWLSLYTLTDDVVARVMAEEGKVHIIEPQHCPPSHATCDNGKLFCAVVLPAAYVEEFNLRCLQLRA